MKRIDFTESVLTSLKRTARCSFANAVYKLGIKAQQGLKCDDLYKKSVLMNDVEKLLCKYELDTCVSFHPELEGEVSSWYFGIGSFTGTITYNLLIDDVETYIGEGTTVSELVTSINNNTEGTGVSAVLGEGGYFTIYSPIGCFVKADLVGSKSPSGTIPATTITFVKGKCPQEETCVDYTEEELNCITPQDLQVLYEFTHKYKETLAKSTKKITSQTKSTSSSDSSDDCCTWGSIRGSIGNQSDLVSYLNTIEKNNISAYDEDTLLSTDINGLKFTGAGVTATNSSGLITVNIPTGGGGPGDNGIDGANSRQWQYLNVELAPVSNGYATLRNSGGAVTLTPSAGATLRLNEFDNTNADLNAWLTALDTYTGTNPGKAYIQITKTSNNSIFGIYEVGNIAKVTAGSDNYYQIGLTYISGGGTFSTSDTITVSWILFGADGSAGTSNITSITAAALLALQGAGTLDTTTLYVVTDAHYVIMIAAKTTSQLSQTGQIIDATYSGTVDYDLGTNTFLNGTIYDGDGNTWNGCLPSVITKGTGCASNIFLANGSNTLGDDCRRNLFKQGTNGWTFGDQLSDVTIESASGATGLDCTNLTNYSFLYNGYPAEIRYDSINWYHTYYDPANDRIVTTLMVAPFTVSYIGGGGGGDVVGPASAVNNNIVLFDGTTGKLIKDSGAALSSKLDVAAGANYRLTASDGSGNRGNAAAITAAMALISNANGIPTHSSVTATTLGYLDATSSVQTQLNGKQASLGFTPENVANKATNFTTLNSTLYPTTQAVADYVAQAVAGLLDLRGTYDASTNLFPSTGGSGTAGAILKGDLWVISVAGTLGGESVIAGQSIFANVDTPAQTAANWEILPVGIITTPNLQQVLDAGSVSTTQMAISDGTDTIAVKKDVIVMTNGLGGEATISSPTLTTATEFRLPNKASSPQTFAMLSDIGSSDSWASTEVTGNLTATNNTQYINTASATYTDPSPTQAKGYLVYVRNGTATIGGVGYSAAGTIIWRVYHSGAWATYVIQDKTANDAAYLKLTGGSLSGALNEAKGTDIASATTTDIGAATGNYVVITGTTTITGLGTVQAGTRRDVNFSGILTLTHNGTSLILPTGANITTAAGDTATFISLGSGNWVCVNYQRASGEALVGAASNTFTIQCAFTTITTVNDGASYHFGILQGVSASGTANRRDFKFTQAGTLKIVSLSLDQATNGSNETVNIYLRNVTTATDYSIGTFTSDFGANTTLKTRFTGLSIAVNTSDDWVVKILTPTWGTNPSSWTGAVILDIQV